MVVFLRVYYCLTPKRPTLFPAYENGEERRGLHVFSAACFVQVAYCLHILNSSDANVLIAPLFPIFACREKAWLSGSQAVIRVEEHHHISSLFCSQGFDGFSSGSRMQASWLVGELRHPLSCQVLSPPELITLRMPALQTITCELQNRLWCLQGITDQIQSCLTAIEPPDADVAAVADALVKVVEMPLANDLSAYTSTLLRMTAK